MNLHFSGISGEVAALIRARDWSDSPLGPPQQWPRSLRVVVSLMLASKFPMFLAWGPELGCLYNDAYAEIIGDKHPAALGRRFPDIWAELWEDVRPLVERALAGEATYLENLPLTMHRHGYDEQTWFTFSYSPLFDEHGAIVGMYCTCTETTEATLVARHRDSELERMRQLFQQAPGIIAVLRGPEHVFEIANEAYMRLVGQRDVVGRRARDALPEIGGQGLFELLDNVYRSGEPFIGQAVPVHLQRAPGGPLEERFVDFIYQPIRDEIGRVTGIFVEGSDVTDAVQAMAAVRESEQRLRQFANSIPQLAWIAGADGAVQWLNDRWYQFTGTNPEEVKGWGWTRLVRPDELPALAERWSTSLATGAPYEITGSLRGADGSYRRFFVRAAPVRDADGRIVQWFGTNTDITDLQAAQDALREAARRKDEFLAMLAHELRNPLAPISTAARVLRMRGSADPDVAQASAIIARQVEHMVTLVDDLLDVSRFTRGLVELQMECLDINEVVAQAVEQVRPLIEARDHTLTSVVAGHRVDVSGDRTRLTQVVANLLNNAAKYTPPGGRIELRIHVGDEHVSIVVADNGIGIDAALLPQLFTLFTQGERTPDRSQGGLGIGLALTRSIVEMHHGTIEACSDGPGRGSTFTVTLPRLECIQASAQPVASVLPRMQVAERTVLVVDDNIDAAQSLATLLEAVGYDVSVCHDAATALAQARERAFDTFILDIGLPDLDGYELARQLRAGDAPDAVLVALTGYGQPQDRERSREAGFDVHFVKPADPQALIDALGRTRR
jgi:PAS domain S-box-containing protein